MTKKITMAEFSGLFATALENAAREADRQLGTKVPRAFLVELHGAGHAGDLMEFDQVLSCIYLGETRFYKIIDVAIRAVSATNTIAFVRASGHQPVEFERTWNPQELGPFKQLIPAKILDQRTSWRRGHSSE